MTHAEALTGHIERQQREIRSVLAKLDATSAVGSGGSSWNAREILLHLLGATRRSADDLRQARGESAEATHRQAGGEYVDVPSLATAHEVAFALRHTLDEMRDSMQVLDDEALGRRVTIEIAGTGPADVPIGVVLRNGLTAHFDDHVAQLRELLD